LPEKPFYRAVGIIPQRKADGNPESFTTITIALIIRLVFFNAQI